MTKALIFGVDGQDGSYLAELLLEKGYRVTGWVPSAIPTNFTNIQPLLGGSGAPARLEIVQGDLSDQASLVETLLAVQPDEIYNLASPSFTAGSWSSPVLVGDIAGLGVVRLLEAIRQAVPKARFFQASTAEMFGIPAQVPQSETTPFQPRNPYGIAKLSAHWSVIRWRERYGLLACSAILFNHESPRRGEVFVSRKIALGAARIKLGLQTELRLGDLDARRDWHFAGDAVRAMWLMLQRPPAEYVIGLGQTYSVRQFCEQAFACLDLDYRDYVVQDPAFMRPPETVQLVADPSKANRELGWRPEVSFAELVRLMVMADYHALGGSAR